MQEFNKIFENEIFNHLIDKTYIPISLVENISEDKITDINTTIKKYREEEIENISQPYLVITGLIGSGKTTLAREVERKKQKKLYLQTNF